MAYNSFFAFHFSFIGYINHKTGGLDIHLGRGYKFKTNSKKDLGYVIFSAKKIALKDNCFKILLYFCIDKT